MATRVRCKLSNQEEFKITCIEDIDEVFTKNNIIPHYREHLKHVNTCLLMFEELETNRTWGEKILDWNYGARSEINGPRLIDNLKKLKKELLEGLTQYTRLLTEKEELKNYIREFIVSKSDLDITHEKVGLISIKKGAKYIGGAGVSVGVLGVIATQCTALTVTISALSVFGIGVCVGVVAGGLLYAIHLIAKSYGDERGVKYQEVKVISDTLDSKFLGKIKTYHEDLNTIFINMKNIREGEKPKSGVGIVQACKLYKKSKDESFNDLKREGYSDDLCEKMSKKLAIVETESCLTYKLGCSKKEAEEICKEIQEL